MDTCSSLVFSQLSLDDVRIILVIMVLSAVQLRLPLGCSHPIVAPFERAVSDGIESVLLHSNIDCLRKAMNCPVKSPRLPFGLLRCIFLGTPYVHLSGVASQC